MNRDIVVAAAALVLWVLLAFVLAVPSGWAHLPLPVAVVFIVRAVVGPSRTGT